MIANNDYDLARPLATAIRAVAPWVGIPMPGFAPLTVRREKLAAALRGVKPLDVRVIASDDGRSRWLVVEGTASDGRVRTCCKMLATPASYWKTWQGKDELAKWRDEAKPKPVSAVAVVKLAKPKNFVHAVGVIKRLQRELDGMYGEYQLRNPCLLGSRRDPEYDGGEWAEQRSTARRREEERWQDYRQTRRRRTEVGALAHQMRNEPSRKLYEAMRARGWDFTGYSEVRQPDKDRHASHYGEYLKELWRFVRGTGPQAFIEMRRYVAQRVSESPVPTSDDKVLVWGPARYQVKLEDMRARQGLRDQIAAVVAECPAAELQVKVEKLQRDLKAKWYRRREGVAAELEAAKAELEAALTVKPAEVVAIVNEGEAANHAA